MISNEYCKDSIVNSVIDKFITRSDIGLQKYGTTLERDDLTTYDWINHAQEELMDAILYLEKLKNEEISTIYSKLKTKTESKSESQEKLSNHSENDVNIEKNNNIDVAIIMGSDSDLHIMKQACEILDEFNITYECTIVSAHRTPKRMFNYAESARSRGIKVIIAGAGGAAHLPGMVASLTTLPVIGVPVKTSTLDGNDSLLSIVQMPRGIPVATVAIGNATNAALLAIRIMTTGLSNPSNELLNKLDKYMNSQEKEVITKANKLENIGFKKYLNINNNYNYYKKKPYINKK